LAALLPETIVEHEHEGGGRRTYFPTTDGMSQQVCHSQVLPDDKSFDGDFGGCEEEDEEDNVFTQSLTVGPRHSDEATPRDQLIASFNELTSCLSQLNSDEQQQTISEVEKLLALATNKTRTLLLPLSRDSTPVSPDGLFFLAFQTSANMKRCSMMACASACMHCVIKETV
jgi:hypothetical protein